MFRAALQDVSVVPGTDLHHVAHSGQELLHLCIAQAFTCIPKLRHTHTYLWFKIKIKFYLKKTDKKTRESESKCGDLFFCLEVRFFFLILFNLATTRKI